jgi:hypothetical protein
LPLIKLENQVKRHKITSPVKTFYHIVKQTYNVHEPELEKMYKNKSKTNPLQVKKCQKYGFKNLKSFCLKVVAVRQCPIKVFFRQNLNCTGSQTGVREK